MKALVVFYSYSENGDTAVISKRLAEAIGADTERLELAAPYPDDYDKVLEISKQEVESGATPAIKPLKHDPKEYDLIAIGTPTWWCSMAPAVLTFMRSTDFSGKTVLPYTTHGGQTGNTVDDIRKNAPGAAGAAEEWAARSEGRNGKDGGREGGGGCGRDNRDGRDNRKGGDDGDGRNDRDGGIRPCKTCVCVPNEERSRIS